jgi:RNA polymerase sigma-70 factor (ECF subfamily)
MRLLRALQKVRPDSTRAFFALAGKHMRYELLSLNEHYRAAIAVHQTDGVAGRSGTPAHEPVDPAPSLDELEEWCEFHRQIEKLPQEEREVVDLHFYQGLSKAEAAEILGMHVRMVQRLWNAALQRLRRADKPGP